MPYSVARTVVGSTAASVMQHFGANLGRVFAASHVIGERRVHRALHTDGAVHLHREQWLIFAVRSRLGQVVHCRGKQISQLGV